MAEVIVCMPCFFAVIMLLMSNVQSAGLGIDTQVNQFKVGVNYHFVPGTLFGRW